MPYTQGVTGSNPVPPTKKEMGIVRNFSKVLFVILGLVFMGGCGGGTSFTDLNGSHILKSGGGEIVGPSVNDRYAMTLLEGLINISGGTETNNKEVSCQISAISRWEAKHANGSTRRITFDDSANQTIRVQRLDDHNFSFILPHHGRVTMNDNGNGKAVGTIIISTDVTSRDLYSHSVTFSTSK